MCPQLSTLVTIEYGGRIDTRWQINYSYQASRVLTGNRSFVYLRLEVIQKDVMRARLRLFSVLHLTRRISDYFIFSHTIQNQRTAIQVYDVIPDVLQHCIDSILSLRIWRAVAV